MQICLLSLSLFVSLPRCRLLETQLQAQRRSYDSEVEALRGELQNVKEENNRQQQLLAQNLQLPPEARIEASLQHEITRLTNENLVRHLVRSGDHPDYCSGRMFIFTGLHIQKTSHQDSTKPYKSPAVYKDYRTVPSVGQFA